MKVYWKNEKQDVWRLLVEPAAIILTLCKHPDRWEVTCLNKVFKIGASHRERSAKLQSVDFLVETLGELGQALAVCREEL